METTFVTAGAADLREVIIEMTGCDPVTEPAFEFSEQLPCDRCGSHDATAIVSVDWSGDVTMERLCHLCLRGAAW